MGNHSQTKLTSMWKLLYHAAYNLLEASHDWLLLYKFNFGEFEVFEWWISCLLQVCLCKAGRSFLFTVDCSRNTFSCSWTPAAGNIFSGRERRICDWSPFETRPCKIAFIFFQISFVWDDFAFKFRNAGHYVQVSIHLPFVVT